MCLLSDSVNGNTNESRARVPFSLLSPQCVYYMPQKALDTYLKNAFKDGESSSLWQSLFLHQTSASRLTPHVPTLEKFFSISFIVVIQSISFLWSYSNKILMLLLWVAIFLLFQCLFCIFYSTLYILFST